VFIGPNIEMKDSFLQSDLLLIPWHYSDQVAAYGDGFCVKLHTVQSTGLLSFEWCVRRILAKLAQHMYLLTWAVVTRLDARRVA
jgi:hypothetical protein